VLNLIYNISLLTNILLWAYPGLLTPPQSLVAFWTNLRLSTVSSDGRILELANGTKFLGSDSWRGKLFIRSCYEKLWDTVQGLVESGTRRILITGNPGIGKSCFGLYALRMLAVKRAIVVWQRSRSDSRYLFDGDTVMEGTDTSFKQRLGEKSVW